MQESLESFTQYFKPEVKSQGAKLYDSKKASINSYSDTLLQAYVRVSPSVKVVLKSEGASHPLLQVNCTCPAGKKNRYCKHIWATLLQTEELHSDFLIHKTTLEHAQPKSANTNEDAPHHPAPTYQETAKLRAATYRKEQYQKSKAYQKEKKHGASRNVAASSYSPAVQSALTYFEQNGFPMPNGPDAEIASDARRKLSRFFHPDRGGTHEEVVELNDFCDLIEKHC